MDFDSQKQAANDHNQMLLKADVQAEEETLAMVRQVRQVRQAEDELLESEDEESSEKYLVDDETWLVIAKQRLLNRSENTQPISSSASTTSGSPIQARINRRKTNQIHLPLTLDLSSPLSFSSACPIPTTTTTTTTSVCSPDLDNCQDSKQVELNSVPSNFDITMEDKMLDLKGRAIQLAKDLKEIKAHPEVSVPSDLLDLISPTSSDQGLVDEILQRSLSNTSSCQDMDQILPPIQADVVSEKRATRENGGAHVDSIYSVKEPEDEEEDEEEEEEDPNETIVPITDRALERLDSQDSLERVESLQDDEIPPVAQKEDDSKDINLRHLIKESCRRNSKSLEPTLREVENYPTIALASPRYTSGQSNCAEKRILGATRIDKACPMFLDLSAEGARKLRLKNAGLFRWHMPFRHGLFHQLSDSAEAMNNPLIFAPTGNFYSYLERRKVIPNVYQGPTKRQVSCCQRASNELPPRHDHTLTLKF
ncbi:uncharacterized protein LOC131889171 [Tigriopus californicus]|uniref:uncharacterized protein LOC131889171 n=1 Tax=Tigriopus californicus TaxID=6832 RepID=UPI0027DA9A7F|nr:uncharacterized protein LOC131889171 [Tigriopus californicus]